MNTEIPQNILDQMNKISGRNITAGAVNSGVTSRSQEIDDLINKSSSPVTASKSSSFADTLKSGYDKYASGVNKVATDIFNPIKEAGTDIAQTASDYENSNHSIGDLAKAGYHVAGDIGGAAVRSIGAPISDAVEATGNAIGNSKTLQNLATSKAADKVYTAADEAKARMSDGWNSFSQSHPDLAKAIGDTGNIAQFMALFVGDKPETKEILGNAANTAAEGVKTGANFTKDIAKMTGENVASGAKAAAEDLRNAVRSTPEEKISGVAEDWQKPTTINKPAFNKARAVLDKSPETPKFLAEHGLNPGEHIENGKYVTSDSAEALRDTAGKMSADTLRPSLQMADYTTPKTNIAEIEQKAIETIGKDSETTAADKNAVIKSIKSEGEALRNEHPDGIGLTDMHDNKITYAKNAGYSPIKDPAANIKASANRAWASALQKMIEEKAPEGVPVKDFNSHLSKFYRAADYLDAINGKTAPVSALQKVSRGVAKFGGALAGGHLGGGVVSEFAGYQIGKALEMAAENLTNPMRATFLRNLKITNPEAFAKVADYIGQQEAEAATRPALPAGEAGFKNPIQLGPRSGESSVRSISAKKNPVSVNPKTGKFQTTYSSTPQ